jgi:hypothetical protein
VSGCTAAPEQKPAEVASQTAAQPPAAQYKPVLTLNEVMVYIINHYSHFLWDVDIPGKEPKTAADWDAIEHASFVLAAGGHLTMTGGSGPKDLQWLEQVDWQKHSQSLADAGLAGTRAARAKDVKGVSEAGNQLVLTCINCHREYKLDIPKIWAEEYQTSTAQ